MQSAHSIRKYRVKNGYNDRQNLNSIRRRNLWHVKCNGRPSHSSRRRADPGRGSRRKAITTARPTASSGTGSAVIWIPILEEVTAGFIHIASWVFGRDMPIHVSSAPTRPGKRRSFASDTHYTMLHGHPSLQPDRTFLTIMVIKDILLKLHLQNSGMFRKHKLMTVSFHRLDLELKFVGS